MKKDPVFYTEQQMNEIEAFINEQWGDNKDGYIVHEIESKYVHTDVSIIEDSEGGGITLATFGMGAREMKSPFPNYDRIELVMYGSSGLRAKEDEKLNKKNMIACSELVRLSKYPFANDTWFGHGHTINASEGFTKTFGYQFFFFMEYNHAPALSDLGKVRFLLAVPVYEDERNWMASHDDGSQRFFDAYFDSFADDDNSIFMIDVPRKHIIPDETEE